MDTSFSRPRLAGLRRAKNATATAANATSTKTRIHPEESMRLTLVATVNVAKS
jgi:hypothetical protein